MCESGPRGPVVGGVEKEEPSKATGSMESRRGKDWPKESTVGRNRQKNSSGLATR